MTKRWTIVAALAIVLAGGAVLLRWAPWQPQGPGPGFVSGNGRIEATEVAVATKLAGRVQEMLVDEGAFVSAGQPVARMQIDSLQAQRDEAVARLQQAQLAIDSARVQVAQRESDHQAALAVVAQRESDLDTAQRRLPRSEKLAREGFFSSQLLDDDRAKVHSLQAALTAARSQAKAAQAGIGAARTQVTSAEANVRALQATLARIDVELADSELKAPRDGRVQFRVVQPGEVVGAGARVLQLADLTDVYMTFFLPTSAAGRIGIGSEVRLVLDAAPQYVIPAQASFVADVAQFTPKTVETAEERQKLTFRIKARIEPELLKKYIRSVKTGLPGMAYVRLDEQLEWPAHLEVRLPQ